MKTLKGLMAILSLFSFSGCASLGFGSDCAVTEAVTSPAPDFSVNTTRYRGAAAPVKTLIVLPPTGGMTYLDRRYAEKFCKAGYDVILIEKWSGQTEENTDLELHQRLYTRAQRALDAVVAEVTTPFIGLLGTSVGGTHAAVAAHLQPRLQAVFVITAGITIPEVIVASDQKAMHELKLARRARYNFRDDGEYLRALSRNFTLDPSVLGPGHKKKDLGMIIATEDTTVPTANQMKLAELWQPKLILTYDNGHFWGIFKSWWLSDDEILKFFEDSARKNLN